MCPRDVRYRFEQELGYKAISLRVGAVPLTVRETLKAPSMSGISEFEHSLTARALGELR